MRDFGRRLDGYRKTDQLTNRDGEPVRIYRAIWSRGRAYPAGNVPGSVRRAAARRAAAMKEAA